MQQSRESDRGFRESLLRDESTQRFLKILIGLVLASSAIYSAAALLSGEEFWRSSGAVTALGVGIAALSFFRRGRASFAAYVLIWGLWASLIIQVTISNGLLSRSLMALPLLIVLAGWLLRPRGTLALCLACLLAGAALAFAQVYGVAPLYTSASPLPLVWLAYSIYIFLASVTAFQIFGGFRLRYHRLAALSEDLSLRVEALAASESELRLIVENVPAMFFRGDRETRCLYANKRYYDFYARGRPNLAGLTVREIVGEEVYEKREIGAMLQRVFAGEQFSYRATRPSPQGDTRVLEVSMVPEPDGHGGVQGFIALFRDVTEEVRAEEKFTKAFRASPLAVAITRLQDGRYLDVNEAFVRQFGWRRDEVIGRTSLELNKWVEPEVRAQWVAELHRVGRVTNLEIDFRTQSGETRRVLASAELIEMDGEECALVMTADITERKRAEEALRESEARNRAVLSAFPDLMFICDRGGRFLDYHASDVTALYAPPEVFLGRTIEEVLPENVAQQLTLVGKQADAQGVLQIVEYDLPIEGRMRSFEARALRFGAGKILYVVREISDKRQAEAALRASHDRFFRVFRASPVAISISHLEDGLYLDVNDAFVEQFGYSREELIDRTSVEVGLWPDQTERERWVAALRERGTLRNYEARLRGKQGEEHSVLIAAEQIQFGAEQCVVGQVHDITERLRAEQEIRRLNTDLERRVQERTTDLTAANRELESFAYSISHDLRAPLRSIDGFSHLLAEEYAARLDPAGQSYLERVRRAAQRMGRLIDDILELSRVTRQSMHRSPVDLARIAREVLDELGQAGPARQVAIEIAAEITAEGDPQLVRVLLQNLLENAWKYTSRMPQARIRVGVERQGTEEVYFVADNGVGFDMLYADRLFVPFQRLHKPEDFEGTGIGLATVARIVHRHGGRVWAESAPGKGTTIRFTLPGAGSGTSR